MKSEKMMSKVNITRKSEESRTCAVFGRGCRRKLYKRGLGMLISAMVLISTLSIALPAITSSAAVICEEGPDIYGQSYCVIDIDSGEVVAGMNATRQYYPASITKVLTALVTLEHVENLDEALTFSQNAVGTLTSDSSTLTPVAAAGECMSVRDTLYGLLLVSGNECANALAEHVAGSTEAFAQLMNERAKEIGCVNSHFANAHGLQNTEHYTCAYDMALIFTEALKNETFYEIDSTVKYTIMPTNMNAKRELTMGHKMLNGSVPYEGVFAGKTGRTPYAGRTLLTAATHNGKRYAICLMKSNDDCFYIDAQILLDYVYGLADGKTPGSWQPVDQVMYTTGNANARQLPTVRAFVGFTYEPKAQCKVTATNGEWARVEGKEMETFYVSATLLTSADPVKNPEEYEKARKAREAGNPINELALEVEPSDNEPSPGGETKEDTTKQTETVSDKTLEDGSETTDKTLEDGTGDSVEETSKFLSETATEELASMDGTESASFAEGDQSNNDSSNNPGGEQSPSTLQVVLTVILSLMIVGVIGVTIFLVINLSRDRKAAQRRRKAHNSRRGGGLGKL